MTVVEVFEYRTLSGHTIESERVVAVRKFPARYPHDDALVRRKRLISLALRTIRVSYTSITRVYSPKENGLLNLSPRFLPFFFTFIVGSSLSTLPSLPRLRKT